MDKFASPISPEVCLSSGKSKQQNISDTLFKQRTVAAKKYICRWAYEVGASFNSLQLNSFQEMLEAVGRFGPGLDAPTRYELTEPFLKKEIDRTKDLLKTHEEEWKMNGCSIMTDAWTDRKRRSIMNLCINSRLGTIFLSSKEFSDISHTSEVIFKYVDECIEEIGEDNVVQIVTDNTSNNMGAAKMLKEKRPRIFWTSCAAHTIDLMLESIAKQPRFKKIIDQAKALTVFLYAHHQILALMRSHTKSRDIVRPGITRFASAFLTLQSINDQRFELKAMFGTTEWERSKYSKSVKGKASYTTVMSMGFWAGVALCLQIFTPLIKVLRIADADKKPSMGFLYGELVQAKEDIKVALNNIPKNYESIFEVIDARMMDRLNTPLHLLAYALNPYYHYKNPLLHLDQDVLLGVIDCLDILFPEDVELQNQLLSVELPKYRQNKFTFGKTVATAACAINDAKFDPVVWWSNFGSNTSNLQRLAMRILSLTSSSSGCERNWSSFEGVHTKKRNRLRTKLVNNLVFIQFNARLLNKQKIEDEKSDDDKLLSHDSTCAQAWLIDGIDDDKDDDEDDDGVGGFEGHTSHTPKYRGIRELYDDDFDSEEEEFHVNEDGNELDEELEL